MLRSLRIYRMLKKIFKPDSSFIRILLTLRLAIGPQLNGNYQNGSSICLGKDNHHCMRPGDYLGDRKLDNKIPHLHNAMVNPLDPNLDELTDVCILSYIVYLIKIKYYICKYRIDVFIRCCIKICIHKCIHMGAILTTLSVTTPVFFLLYIQKYKLMSQL